MPRRQSVWSARRRLETAKRAYLRWLRDELRARQWRETPDDTEAIERARQALRTMGFVREADYILTPDDMEGAP